MNNYISKVLVIGDVMLDQYYSGQVLRISPEAPVPVIKMEGIKKILGGASNVSNNISSLGSETAIIGTIGTDDAGKSVSDILRLKGVDVSGLNIRKGFRTLTKVRVIGNEQQIARLDFNDDEKPEKVDIKEMLEKFRVMIDYYNVVVISDYNKGTCTSELCREVINISRNLNKIVIVDPKGNDWGKYSGATFITPNLKEISGYLGIHIKNDDKEIEEKCEGLTERLNVENVLITRSEMGMTLINKEVGFRHFKSKAKEVFDVSGAGDTVIAALAAFLAEHDNILESINLANVAAGIVVGKRGTATVSQQEIEGEINVIKNGYVGNKIMELNDLINLVNSWKEKGESIAFTNGCYDIFHKGHVFSIYSAAEFGDHLIVAVNSDDSVKRLKGQERPINNQYDRAYVIASLGCVDAVIIFNEDTPETLLSRIKPNVLVKGGDYKANEVIGKQYADKVEIIQYVDGYSTTNLIKKMNKN